MTLIDAATAALGLPASVAEGLVTKDEARDLLTALIEIKEQATRAERFGLTLTACTLEYKARDLAGAFVRPASAVEAREQLNADHARLTPGESAKAIDEKCGF